MKTCVLFSGGWDSVAAAIKRLNDKPDLLFIDYRQLYADKEYNHAFKIALELKLPLIVKTLDLYTDVKNRNYYLILKAKELGYEKVILGTRNIIPLFDKYKDSNWLSLKIAGWLFRIKVSMPIIAWSKKQIINYVQKNIKNTPYNCYFNNSDYKSCECVNCKELRQIWA